MSFMRTLATVAVGFAAAKGISKYKNMGGMAGMKDQLASSGQPGGMVDQIAQMADKMGIPGGSAKVKEMMAQFGAAPAAATEAGQAGLAGLLSAIKGSAEASGQAMDNMFEGITKGTPVGAVVEDNAKLMIRAMIQAAKADGELDDDEKRVILEQLKDATPEERAFVEEQLAAPVDYAALARDTGEAMRAQVYATSLMAVKVDSAAEVAYLKQLSGALGLSPQMRDHVHKTMGVDPLPA